MRAGGKTEQLLSWLALYVQTNVHRETLVEQIWPDTSAALANQSLKTLAHGLKRQLSDALGGQPPIIHLHSHYALNLDSGLTVDVLAVRLRR